MSLNEDISRSVHQPVAALRGLHCGMNGCRVSEDLLSHVYPQLEPRKLILKTIDPGLAGDKLKHRITAHEFANLNTVHRDPANDFLIKDIVAALDQVWEGQRVELNGRLGRGAFGESFLLKVGGNLLVLKVIRPDHYEGSPDFVIPSMETDERILNHQYEHRGLQFNGLPRGYAFIRDNSDNLIAIAKSLVGGIRLDKAIEEGMLTRRQARSLLIRFLTAREREDHGLVLRDFHLKDFHALVSDNGEFLRFPSKNGDRSGDDCVLMHIDPGIWTPIEDHKKMLANLSDEKKRLLTIRYRVKLILDPKFAQKK